MNGAPHSRWILAALATLALAGCANQPAPAAPNNAESGAAAVAAAAATAQAEAAAGAAAPQSAPTKVELWAVQSGPLGVLVTDGDGLPIYRYERDATKPPNSTCTGDCTKQWPPVLLADGKQPELDGVDPALVGSIQRPDGQRQLTLAGWPLYRHTGDDGGLATTYGNGADNAWYAISPTGDRARP